VGSSLTVSGLAAPAGSNFTLRSRIASYNGTQTVTASTSTSVTYVITGGFGLAYSLSSAVSAGIVTLADSAPTPFAASNAGSIKVAWGWDQHLRRRHRRVTVPNAGVAGANVRGRSNQPISRCPDLGNNDQMVYIAGRRGRQVHHPARARPASYQLTMWDYPQDMIIDSSTWTVAGGKAVNIGQKGPRRLVTPTCTGTVLPRQERQRPPRRSESGVRSSVDFKERDNSMWDQRPERRHDRRPGQLRHP